jgi:hypothetical protein
MRTGRILPVRVVAIILAGNPQAGFHTGLAAGEVREDSYACGCTFSANSVFQVRQCSSEDFDDWVRLLRQFWPDKQLDSALLRAVSDRAIAPESQMYLCAPNGQRVIGFGSLTPEE